ncbi:MAG: 6-phosphofructokinase [Ilumatobacteraceae bacterium]
MGGQRHLAVLTSGGDAQGMNAAVRAVVRTGLARGAKVSAIYEGFQGLVDDGAQIREMSWVSVAGILQLGGTVIGTARSAAFREREGRLRAAEHFVGHDIDSLVVIGGDGSLTGADVLRHEWSGLLDELVAAGRITRAQADRHPAIAIVGLVGSIDNDMAGTDMTIGADTALHRITEAIDAITSTAASHQRTFVVEVMGRKCGYLALYSALAGGADWVIIPEAPPEAGWEDVMATSLREGRESGRRDSIVVVAEGAVDHDGVPITGARVAAALEQRLGVDVRVTVLGHVQRGGAPSAYDRYMSTLLGHAAVTQLLDHPLDAEPQLIGVRGGQITTVPLMPAVERTRQIAEAMAAGDHDRAVDLRGGNFLDTLDITTTMMKVYPDSPSGVRPRRLAVLHAGGPAPGMNTAARVVTRRAIDAGHEVLGVIDGFDGLVEGQVRQLDWTSVSGWGTTGGAELGVARRTLDDADLAAIARTITDHRIDGLMVIGGWSAYESVHALYSARGRYPAFDIPMLCIPATIDNNAPGSTMSIGADTALNTIVFAIDRIKQSAVAAGRCFVVEVMGRWCGYLALMTGIACGAERVFLNEEGVSLDDLRDELARMIDDFARGKRLNLVIRNEYANDIYTTAFMCALFEEEGGSMFSVRQTVLGHQQQGGDPTPFDRVLASRLGAHGVQWWIEQLERGATDAAFIGMQGGRVAVTDMAEFSQLVDVAHQRPVEQWWMDLRAVAETMSHGSPDALSASD